MSENGAVRVAGRNQRVSGWWGGPRGRGAVQENTVLAVRDCHGFRNPWGSWNMPPEGGGLLNTEQCPHGGGARKQRAVTIVSAGLTQAFPVPSGWLRPLALAQQDVSEREVQLRLLSPRKWTSRCSTFQRRISLLTRVIPCNTDAPRGPWVAGGAAGVTAPPMQNGT